MSFYTENPRTDQEVREKLLIEVHQGNSSGIGDSHRRASTDDRSRTTEQYRKIDRAVAELEAEGLLYTWAHDDVAYISAFRPMENDPPEAWAAFERWCQKRPENWKAIGQAAMLRRSDHVHRTGEAVQ